MKLTSALASRESFVLTHSLAKRLQALYYVLMLPFRLFIILKHHSSTRILQMSQSNAISSNVSGFQCGVRGTRNKSVALASRSNRLVWAEWHTHRTPVFTTFPSVLRLWWKDLVDRGKVSSAELRDGDKLVSGYLFLTVLDVFLPNFDSYSLLSNTYPH